MLTFPLNHLYSDVHFVVDYDFMQTLGTLRLSCLYNRYILLLYIYIIDILFTDFVEVLWCIHNALYACFLMYRQKI